MSLREIVENSGEGKECRAELYSAGNRPARVCEGKGEMLKISDFELRDFGFWISRKQGK